jgi:hypothetical protein
MGWPNDEGAAAGPFRRYLDVEATDSSVAASHKRTVPSALPATSVWPSAEKVSDVTDVTDFPDPRRTARSCAAAMSHSRTSLPAMASTRPSGVKDTA